MAIRAFEKGLREIRAAVSGLNLLSFEESRENTGPEAFFLLAADAPEIKRKMTSIEENHGLGRLFDIDVLGPDSVPLSRSVLGLPPRSCLICGEKCKGLCQKPHPFHGAGTVEDCPDPQRLF